MFKKMSEDKSDGKPEINQFPLNMKCRFIDTLHMDHVQTRLFKATTVTVVKMTAYTTKYVLGVTSCFLSYSGQCYG